MALELTHIPVVLLTKPETDSPWSGPGVSLTSTNGALLPTKGLLYHGVPACCAPAACASRLPLPVWASTSPSVCAAEELSADSETLPPACAWAGLTPKPSQASTAIATTAEASPQRSPCGFIRPPESWRPQPRRARLCAGALRIGACKTGGGACQLETAAIVSLRRSSSVSPPKTKRGRAHATYAGNMSNPTSRLVNIRMISRTLISLWNS